MRLQAERTRGDRPSAGRPGGRAAADRAGAARPGGPGADRGAAAALPRPVAGTRGAAGDRGARRRIRCARASRTCAGSRSSSGPRRSTTSVWRARWPCCATGSHERSGLDVTCRVAEPLPAALAPDAELVIYRVAQEALTNVARHSGSDRAELSLQPDDDRRRAHRARPTAGASANGGTDGQRDPRHARAGGADRRRARDPRSRAPAGDRGAPSVAARGRGDESR